jgi:hypothetical protein
MRLKMLLYRKGIFSRLDGESSGVNGHNADDIYLWRKVLDEMLISYVSTDTSASEHSKKWFNSQPGDLDWYVLDEGGDEGGVEYEVDMYDEFCEACSYANLDPVLVRDVANRSYDEIKQEGK